MGRMSSIFVFFTLSTVALIVMQSDPTDEAGLASASAIEASRNSLTVLSPEPESVALPVPDDVIAQIKRAGDSPAPEEEESFLVAPAAQSVSLMAEPEVPTFTAPTQPRFQAAPTAPQQPSYASSSPIPASEPSQPASSELRDMSWSALGTLQQLRGKPSNEGSLINSIVRRSMAHVDTAPSAPETQMFQAPQALQSAPQPRAVQAPAQSAPRLSAIGARQTYTVAPGDNLALIAIKLYGSALETDRLLAENPALRSNPNALRIGQVISYSAN